MEEVTRKRVLRRLEALPEDQLYQALDFIEFLETKYARMAARKPDAFQEFAERMEDRLRVRSLSPRAMRGTMKVMSTAGKVFDGVRDLGRGLVAPPDKPGAAPTPGRAGETATAGREAGPPEPS
jgi:hypothetical protein